LQLFFTCDFLLKLLSSISQKVKVCSVLFDNRFELNSDLKAIVEMTRPNISPELYAKSLNFMQLHAVRSEVLA